MTKADALAKRCKTRGGDCPCPGACQAIKALDAERAKAEREQVRIGRQIESIDNQIKRLSTPIAKLREGFEFDNRYTPVIVFDCPQATFGYVDDDGEWIEANCWPFDQDYVWADDCEANGIRVE